MYAYIYVYVYNCIRFDNIYHIGVCVLTVILLFCKYVSLIGYK